MTPTVGIVMGSQSDWPTLKPASEVLDELGVGHEVRIVSAHRDAGPALGIRQDGKGPRIEGDHRGSGRGSASSRHDGLEDHPLPVIGVPVETRALRGVDSLYSILQMPRGYPVATMAIGQAGACNAGLMAAGILALSDSDVAERLDGWRAALTKSVAEAPHDE